MCSALVAGGALGVGDEPGEDHDRGSIVDALARQALRRISFSSARTWSRM
jgi:hypothetical protein